MLFMRFDPENIDSTLKSGFFGFSANYPKSAINLNVYAVLEKITVPVLILHGNKDKIVNISYAKKAVNTVKNGKLCVIEGAGHGFNKKQVKTANGIIVDFWEYNKQNRTVLFAARFFCVSRYSDFISALRYMIVYSANVLIKADRLRGYL